MTTSCHKSGHLSFAGNCGQKSGVEPQKHQISGQPITAAVLCSCIFTSCLRLASYSHETPSWYRSMRSATQSRSLSAALRLVTQSWPLSAALRLVTQSWPLSAALFYGQDPGPDEKELVSLPQHGGSRWQVEMVIVLVGLSFAEHRADLNPSTQEAEARGSF